MLGQVLSSILLGLMVLAVAREHNAEKPKGTLAVMAILSLLIVSVWLLMYFGVFLQIGGVSRE